MRRCPESQKKHDQVIADLALTVRDGLRDGRSVATNPDGQQNWPLPTRSGPVYPDVLVLRGREVTDVYEVETEDSVVEAETAQWDTYASAGKPFYLCVPRNLIGEAKRIWSPPHNAIILGYFYEGNRLKLSLEPW